MCLVLNTSTVSPNYRVNIGSSIAEHLSQEINPDIVALKYHQVCKLYESQFPQGLLLFGQQTKLDMSQLDLNVTVHETEAESDNKVLNNSGSDGCGSNGGGCAPNPQDS
jgi:hypothetical protein